MSDSKKVGFSLKAVTTEQFAIIEDIFKQDQAVELNLKSGFIVNQEERIIISVFKVQFVQKKSPFLILETACHYEITPDTWSVCYDKEKNQVSLSGGFARHLLMLNIGTSRGVLHAKTEDSVFNQFMLPAINVNTLIDKDVVFQLDQESPKE